MRIAAALMLLALLAAGCSVENSDITTKDSEGFTEATLATAPRTAPTPPQQSTGEYEEITLRLGGKRGLEFSGLCTSARSETVITGTVPRRYTFTPGEFPISCQIQRQSPGRLKVVLEEDDETLSIQQTNGDKSTLRFSYPPQ